MNKRLGTKIDQFVRKYGFARYVADEHTSDLEFFNGDGEAFALPMYPKGSPIRSDWEKLQNEVKRDLRAAKKQ